MKIRILFVILIFLEINHQIYSQSETYIDFQQKYDFYRREKKLDSALIFARKMNSWAFKNEGDTSLRYAISFRAIGNCFSQQQVDSSTYYYLQSISLLKDQKRELHIEMVYSYNNLCYVLSNSTDFKSAEPYQIKLVELRKIIQGENHSDYISSLNNLGFIYSKIHDYYKAEQIYSMVIENRKKFLGETHPDYEMSLDKLVKFYYEISELSKAEKLIKEIIRIRKIKLGENDLKYIESLNDLGLLYYQLDEFIKSEDVFKEVLTIKEKVLGKNHIEIVKSLNNLGAINLFQGQYELVEDYAKKSISILENKKDTNHYEFATALILMCDIYSMRQYYNIAEEFCNRATQITKIIYGDTSIQFADNLKHLALLKIDKGEFDNAEKTINKSLLITAKKNGANNLNYASKLSVRGNLYVLIGELKKAEQNLIQSANIRKEINGQNHSDYATSLNSLGILYTNIGDNIKAIELYKESLKIRKKVFGIYHPDYIITLNNIGSTNMDIGEYNLSEKIFFEALKLFDLAKTKNYSDFSIILNNIGSLYWKKGDFQKALQYTTKSLKVRKKYLGKDHPDYAWSLNNIGLIYEEQNRLNKAKKQYQKAIEIRKKHFSENHNDLLVSYYNLAILLQKLGKNDLAEKNFTKISKFNTQNISSNFDWLSSFEKKSYLFKHNYFFNSVNSFAYKSNIFSSEISSLTFNSNLLSKSILLETSRELDQAISNSSDELLKVQFTEMKQLRRLINKIQSEGSDKKEIIDRYNSQADSLDKILVNKIGEYANIKRKYEITWKDVQTSLLSTDAAIEFTRYYDYKDSTYKYMALVVRAGYEYPKLVKLDSELNIKNASSQREFSELYKYVWSGIDSLLTGVKTIYYSPIGELNNVSFSALMSETNNQSDSTKSNWSYLIDRYDLHQVTTTRYLADGTLKKNESIPLSIKLIGGVNYSDLPLSKDSVDVNETTEDFALQINLQNEMNNSKSNRGGKISYLKGSEIEVKEIAKTLKNLGWVTTISDGKNASEYQFKQELNEKSPGIIHIATHGFAFPEKVTKEENGLQMKETSNYKVSEDPMVRCGLMLSGANVSWSGDSKKMIETTGDDGILTAAEVANLDLSNTKLVVLSACETGLGKIESSEGTFGLKRGFKLAGVDQIIVSLWKVPDNESMELMTLFYSELAKSNDIDSSFNKAQKEMRNRYPYDPEKWAGFVLVR